VQMNVFRTNRSYLKYPLTPACRKSIRKALARDRDILFPSRRRGA
jgi:hypothetical protein